MSASLMLRVSMGVLSFSQLKFTLLAPFLYVHVCTKPFSEKYSSVSNISKSNLSGFYLSPKKNIHRVPQHQIEVP
jgi:hypothetical protein